MAQHIFVQVLLVAIIAILVSSSVANDCCGNSISMYGQHVKICADGYQPKTVAGIELECCGNGECDLGCCNCKGGCRSFDGKNPHCNDFCTALKNACKKSVSSGQANTNCDQDYQTCISQCDKH